MRRVAVVGGGWSGLAAAVHLAGHGIACTVFEASRTLGGRARRVPWTTIDGDTVALDNGQHILIGAYRETLDLLRRVGIDRRTAFERMPLALTSFDGLRLRASTQRAPWHLLTMLVTARGLGLADRWAIVSFMRSARGIGWTLEADITVDRLFERWRQPHAVVLKVWEPLCVAALNTPIATASAQVFLNVLRDSLGSDSRADSDLLLPRVDLGTLLPDAAFRALVQAGGEVRLGTRVQNLHRSAEHVSLAAGTATDVGAPESFDAVVLAVPPLETARLLSPSAWRDADVRTLVDACERFDYQPIVTAYLRYRQPPNWPSRMMVMTPAPKVGAFGQWAFDRSDRLDSVRGGSGLVAVVVSADGPHRALEQPALVDALAAQIAAVGGLPSRPLESRIVVEKRATFACTPGLARLDGSTPDPRIRLAGDHVATGGTDRHYPATLETAVASGVQAATALIAQRDSN